MFLHSQDRFLTISLSYCPSPIIWICVSPDWISDWSPRKRLFNLLSGGGRIEAWKAQPHSDLMTPRPWKTIVCTGGGGGGDRGSFLIALFYQFITFLPTPNQHKYAILLVFWPPQSSPIALPNHLKKFRTIFIFSRWLWYSFWGISKDPWEFLRSFEGSLEIIWD